MKIYRKLLKRYFKYCRRKTEVNARNYLHKNRELNNLIFESNKQSKSFGLSDFEYVTKASIIK
jgi:hypothetical protein